MAEIPIDVKHRIDEFAEQVRRRAEESYLHSVDVMSSRCESPIEILLVAAIVAEAGHWPVKCFFYGKYGRHFFSNTANVNAQIEIGPYRADFLIEASLDGGRPSLRLDVECDGHDFHERTKEQAARDRQRDRWMQAHDIAVMRFTGSEIWKDPIDCADQILAFVTDKI